MKSQMLREALQGPGAAALALQSDRERYTQIGAALRAQPPQAILTIARGSSDHAAHFMAYLTMARLGRLVTSLPMSIITLYSSQLQCAGLLSVAFSQSGQSPDLVLPQEFIGSRGGQSIAVVNDAASPLALASRWVLPLHAGPETSVAATKSYLAQLLAGTRLIAHWQDNRPLLDALERLPEALERAAALDWQAMVTALVKTDRLMVIGRGLGLPIALEAALKLKEVCAIQAEAFSSAEVQHGPMALVEQGYPLLILAPRGPAQAGLLTLAREMRERGARVLLAAPEGTPGAELPLATTEHEDLDPIAVAQSFYVAAEALARARGLDPDHPRHLRKVTRTH